MSQRDRSDNRPASPLRNKISAVAPIFDATMQMKTVFDICALPGIIVIGPSRIQRSTYVLGPQEPNTASAPLSAKRDTNRAAMVNHRSIGSALLKRAAVMANVIKLRNPGTFSSPNHH